MTGRETDYLSDAQHDARETAENFIDTIVEMLRDSGEASNDLYNDYPNGDAYHHESHVDRDYSLTEAAAVLDQLSRYEEDDRGLWEGLEPRRAIAAQAAYTYGNAVYHLWRDIIRAVNNDAENGILHDMLGEDDPAADATVAARVREIIREA